MEIRPGNVTGLRIGKNRRHGPRPMKGSVREHDRNASVNTRYRVAQNVHVLLSFFEKWKSAPTEGKFVMEGGVDS
jgi:hypothetical protein